MWHINACHQILNLISFIFFHYHIPRNRRMCFLWFFFTWSNYLILWLKLPGFSFFRDLANSEMPLSEKGGTFSPEKPFFRGPIRPFGMGAYEKRKTSVFRFFAVGMGASDGTKNDFFVSASKKWKRKGLFVICQKNEKRKLLAFQSSDKVKSQMWWKTNENTFIDLMGCGNGNRELKLDL